MKRMKKGFSFLLSTTWCNINRFCFSFPPYMELPMYIFITCIACCLPYVIINCSHMRKYTLSLMQLSYFSFTSNHSICKCSTIVCPLCIQKSIFIMNITLENKYNFQSFHSGIPIALSWPWPLSHVDGLVQERRNSIANALELRLSCTNPSMYPSL